MVEQDDLDPEFARHLRWCAEQLGAQATAELAALPEDVAMDVDGLGRCSSSTRRRAATASASRGSRRTTSCASVLDGARRRRRRLRAHARAVRPPRRRHAPRQRGQRRLAVGRTSAARTGAPRPDVELRRTDYDVDAAVASFDAGFPDAEFGESLLHPPGPTRRRADYEERR
jgi:hypothetical protein